MVIFICFILDQKCTSENSKSSTFQHGVWLSQNETGVKKVDRHFKNVKYFSFTL